MSLCVCVRVHAHMWGGGGGSHAHERENVNVSKGSKDGENVELYFLISLTNSFFNLIAKLWYR
jgi:hypothetical protein